MFKETSVIRIFQGREITCIASEEIEDAEDVDSTDFRVVIGTIDRVVQLWSLNSRFQLQMIFSVQLDSTVPRSIKFSNDHERNIVVYTLGEGYM